MIPHYLQLVILNLSTTALSKALSWWNFGVSCVYGVVYALEHIFNGVGKPQKFSSKLELACPSVKLFHLKQFAIYDILSRYSGPNIVMNVSVSLGGLPWSCDIIMLVMWCFMLCLTVLLQLNFLITID